MREGMRRKISSRRGSGSERSARKIEREGERMRIERGWGEKTRGVRGRGLSNGSVVLGLSSSQL